MHVPDGVTAWEDTAVRETIVTEEATGDTHTEAKRNTSKIFVR